MTLLHNPPDDQFYLVNGNKRVMRAPKEVHLELRRMFFLNLACLSPCVCARRQWIFDLDMGQYYSVMFFLFLSHSFILFEALHVEWCRACSYLARRMSSSCRRNKMCNWRGATRANDFGQWLSAQPPKSWPTAVVPFLANLKRYECANHNFFAPWMYKKLLKLKRIWSRRKGQSRALFVQN